MWALSQAETIFILMQNWIKLTKLYIVIFSKNTKWKYLWTKKCNFHRGTRFFCEVDPSCYFGLTEGLAGNSKPIYEVCDSKSEKSAPKLCFKGTPLHYSAFARVDMVGTNYDKVLTQWRHMPMGQFRGNIFLMQITSTYFWASEVFKNRRF